MSTVVVEAIPLPRPDSIPAVTDSSISRGKEGVHILCRSYSVHRLEISSEGSFDHFCVHRDLLLLDRLTSYIWLALCFLTINNPALIVSLES